MASRKPRCGWFGVETDWWWRLWLPIVAWERSPTRSWSHWRSATFSLLPWTCRSSCVTTPYQPCIHPHCASSSLFQKDLQLIDSSCCFTDVFAFSSFSHADVNYLLQLFSFLGTSSVDSSSLYLVQYIPEGPPTRGPILPLHSTVLLYVNPPWMLSFALDFSSSAGISTLHSSSPCVLQCVPDGPPAQSSCGTTWVMSGRLVSRCASCHAMSRASSSSTVSSL